jgi:hypothetical protein
MFARACRIELGKVASYDQDEILKIFEPPYRRGKAVSSLATQKTANSGVRCLGPVFILQIEGRNDRGGS